MIPPQPEKMGSFYLGAEYDLEHNAVTSETIHYDSRDLTTHAVCVGMTGSGKTGLCIGLLEEAALDKVPAIIIDPKGDMTNLLLQFGNLSPEEFKPWINVDDAIRKDMTVDDYAASTAKLWKNGLKKWGQGTERIRALKDSVDYNIYTPGSDAGIGVNILGSFAAPKVDFDSDTEMFRERIQGTVAALLGMINCKEDPSRSREGILLSNLFEHYWRQGEDLDLTKLIMGVQKPPMTKLGVFDVDTFYPEKDRFQLAMDFNILVASPQFKYWLQGEPLDIDKIYFTPEGKPKHSIFYIAHLSDSERMFFVTLLLNSVISWMRRQSGTTSLRSLVYFDEIFGYFPPTAEPPSKRPLLTLLKQARAFGVGTVLVTQNPVDIDYKGLSNAGTWFIGKLQTERDKTRVFDGLKGAIAEKGGNTELDFDTIISSLDSRVFLYHNVHEAEPKVFHTRWAMSYLRGPLTRPQLKDLMKEKKSASKATISMAANMSNMSSQGNQSNTQASQSNANPSGPPSIDPSVDQKFFSVWKSANEALQELQVSGTLSLEYEPKTLALGKVRFVDSKSRLDEIQVSNMLTSPPDEFGRVDWNHGTSISDWERAVATKPDYPDTVAATFHDVPASMNSGKELKKVEKEFADWLYQKQCFKLLEHRKFKIIKTSGESDEAFRMRVQQMARENRDEEIDKLQDKFDKKMDSIEDKIRREEHDLEQAEAELRDRKRAEVVGMAETIFSVFVKKRSRSLNSVSTKNRMKRKASQKLAESEDELLDLQDDMIKLQYELQEKIDEITHKWDSSVGDVSIKEVKPRRTDVNVDKVILAWIPYWVAPNGQRVSAVKM